MSAPRPLLETQEASPEVLELLRSARCARPLDHGARERSEWRMARLAAIPAAAGALFWLQHLALGAVLGAVVTAAVVAPRMLSSRPAMPARPEHAETTRARASVRLQTPSAAIPAPSAEPTIEAVSPAPTAQKKPLPITRPKPDGLAREAKMLEQARALVSTDPRGALVLLLQHEQEFLHGTLELEGELLTIEALVHLGRRSEAEERARAFRAHAPGSLYEARLDRLLGKDN